MFAMLAGVNKDPASYREAMSSPDSDEWKKAIEAELQSMRENDVWDLVDRSEIEKEKGRKVNLIT